MLQGESSKSNDFSPQKTGLQTVVFINLTRSVHCADHTTLDKFPYKSYYECSLSMKVTVFTTLASCLILRLNCSRTYLKD